MPINFRPNCCATTPVVPLPQNGSSTVPPGGQPAFIGVSTSSGGNVAKCASLHGFVLILHTHRLFRPSGFGRRSRSSRSSTAYPSPFLCSDAFVFGPPQRLSGAVYGSSCCLKK